MLLFDWKKVYDTAQGNISTCNLIMEISQGKLKLRPGVRVAYNTVFKAPIIPSIKYTFKTFYK